MKDNLTVEKQAAANAAEAEKDTEVAEELAKFKDVQALIEAYRALEAEFTRRSQKLKELENSVANKEETPAQAASEPSPSDGAAEESPYGERQLSADEKNAVIAEYLSDVCRGRGVPFVVGGGAVGAVRRTPRTMSEAGALAKDFFNKKEEK